ncbi:cyclin-like protein [Basidiobolus meristosporus CBS 931.73]|uniref:Cyclin-like protein n=1 Tax=Basidiobolus meristosporus CBS 931.73 TaxID=1314790 RepID=A0A1Y1X1D3_9FUNG|nr:cyclin-like protein [Basidiobolus meristosporus CBS 931.73]|eukprot:ORX79610.1 cyclin-like protein [Basidiobolus meristosporus CBS 931.73]
MSTPYSCQWYFKKEELERTPSIQDGTPFETELIERAKGCNFIVSVGRSLQLPQLTLATATTMLHRFFMRKSLKDYHYYDIGATCLFIATKVEETLRKLRDLIVVCVQKAQKNDQLLVDEDSKEFKRWRDMILYNEEIVMETICFDLAIEHPYVSLLRFVKELRGSKPLAQTAWAFLNDSLRTTLCVMYRPHIVAAAALYIASKYLDEKLGDPAEGKPWWEVIDASIQDIQDASSQILDQYQQLPVIPQFRLVSKSRIPSPDTTLYTPKKNLPDVCAI